MFPCLTQAAVPETPGSSTVKVAAGIETLVLYASVWTSDCARSAILLSLHPNHIDDLRDFSEDVLNQTAVAY